MNAVPHHAEHPDLHELVNQLTPAQADAVRAVVLELVTPTTDRRQAEAGHRLAFVGAGASRNGITPHLDELQPTASDATDAGCRRADRRHRCPRRGH